MDTISRLPFEVWDLILSFNEHRDTKKLACCCRYLFDLLKPIIWRGVTITYPDCGLLKREDKYLQNLRYTEYISFQHDHPFDVEYVVPEYSLYLGKLLSHLNRGKLRELQLDAVAPTSCFNFILETLKFVRVLTLDDIRLTDFSSLCCLQDLRSLTLQTCRLKDDAFQNIKCLTTLEELKVNSCKNLTDDCLVYIGKFKSLSTLSFQYNGYKHNPKPVFKLDQLLGLKNVTDLCLSAVTCSDESLVLLCEHLRRLKELTLQCMYGITNVSFRGLHFLSELNSFDIEQCDGLSEECFLYMESLSSLSRLSFDANICKCRDEERYQLITHYQLTLGKLNDIPSLKRILIRNGGGRIDHEGFRFAMYISSTEDDRALALILEVLCETARWGLEMQPSTHNRVYVLHRSL